jgi:hypothetical protein
MPTITTTQLAGEEIEKSDTWKKCSWHHPQDECNRLGKIVYRDTKSYYSTPRPKPL